MHHQHTGYKVRPDVLGIIQNASATIEFRPCCIGLTDEVGINGVSSESTGHVGRRQFDESDFIRADPLVLHQLMDHEVLITVFAGDGECFPAKITQTRGGKILAHDHRGAVAMPEVKNFHR